MPIPVRALVASIGVLFGTSACSNVLGLDGSYSTGPANNQVAVLQSAVTPCHTGASNLVVTVTLGSKVSKGTVLIAYCQVNLPGVTGYVNSVKDGVYGFTKLAEAGQGQNTDLSIWALSTPAKDVGTKPTIAATPTGNFSVGILVQEVSGIQPALDGTAAAVSGTAAGQTGNPTYASTVAGEYLVSYYADNAGGGQMIASPPAPWAEDPNSVSGSTDGGNQGVAYRDSTGGQESGAWSVNADTSWGVILAAFKRP